MYPSYHKMRILSLVFISTVLCIHSTVVQAQTDYDAQVTAQIRTFIETLLSEDISSQESGQGVYIEWTLKRSSLLSNSEIKKRWAEVEPYVDHPDRVTIKWHKKLQVTPDQVKGEIWFADTGAWKVREDLSTAITGVLSSAGHEKERWRRWQPVARTENITIIGAGVPFPAGYNIGSELNDTVDRVSMFMSFGLSYRFIEYNTISKVDLRGSHWSVVLTRDRDDKSVKVTGRISRQEGLPYVTDIRYLDNQESLHSDRPTLQFQNAVYCPATDRMRPQVIYYTRSDDVLIAFSVHDVQKMDRSEILGVSHVPNLSDPELDTLDFRSKNTETASDDTFHMLWTHDRKGDSYSFPNMENMPIIRNTITGTLAPSPELAQGSESVQDQDTNPTRSQNPKQQWTVAVLISFGAIIFIPVAIYIFRRYKSI